MTREQLLHFIAQMESNGGRNFNHPVITHGISKGVRAIGTYGLTPSTVNDIIKNDPQYENLAAMDPIAKKQYLESNPAIEKNVAGQLVDTLSQRYNNDPAKVRYAWYHGTSLPSEKITPEIMQNDQDTNKFNRLTQKLGVNNSQQANNMPNNEDLLKKTDQNLPTIDVTDLASIINDPNNPFSKDFEDEDEDKYSL